MTTVIAARDGRGGSDSASAVLGPKPQRETAADRRAKPTFLDIAQGAADTFGVCRRPVPMKVIEPDGTERYVGAPCKATLESVCPACAARARSLRIQQCREGWHADAEPVADKRAISDQQTDLVTERADTVAQYRMARDAGDSELAEVLRGVVAGIDEDLRATGMRGRLPELDPAPASRRSRSTRRRQDVPDLPRKKVAATTIGGVYAGRRYSMFVTLTLPSYGRVRDDGAPVDADEYDYRQAARDIVFFAALFDRWIQNLRRVVGYDVQYFATVEPQRRGAPHIHIALRTAISHRTIRRVTEATYHQVWWPNFDLPVYQDGHLPIWDRQLQTFVDPDNGARLPIWDEALEILDGVDDLEPAHVIEFGAQVDSRGILGDTQECNRHIGYLTKYLVKSISEVLQPKTFEAAAHYDRLHEELRYTPCSPRCPVWLRYGIVPRGADETTQAGFCKGKAHRRETLGLRGQRVLVSRRWSGKTLPDHAADRAEFVRQMLAAVGIEKPDTPGVLVMPADSDDPEVPPREQLIMAALAERSDWHTEYLGAMEALGPPGAQDISASSR